MNLIGLQTFLAIAETGSLVRASERLNVTQSTVTARLKGLEDELGQTLFYRQKSGAQLTPAGVRFKRYAEAMAGLWRQAKQETSHSAGLGTACNFACHMDLWPGLGRRFFDAVLSEQFTTALSAWPGGQSDIERWLGVGLVNAALTYQPFSREGHTSQPLGSERLILASTRADSPLRFDPGYVYVDAGEEFARRHAAAYAEADVAKISFGCALWALEHVRDRGGTAYMPERLVEPLIDDGSLFRIAEAPVFSREVYLITADAAAAGWPWLPDLVRSVSFGSS